MVKVNLHGNYKMKEAYMKEILKMGIFKVSVLIILRMGENMWVNGRRIK
jgi:hypothetical protein